ncbi:Thioredoxin domain-containing protein 3 [Rhizophlyctis rosea]|nr:Thioredoxin domain-containing protein 3 [Rhizophlyctis rosea]
MSAHARRADTGPLAALATTDDEWNAHTAKAGLKVVDVYAKWAGPCEPMQSIFKRLKIDFGDQVSFVQGPSLVKIVKGANSPLIERTIKEQLDLEKNNLPHVAISLDDETPLQISTTGFTPPETSPTDDSPVSAMSDVPLEETLAIIKPDAMSPSTVEQIMAIIKRNRFQVKQIKKVWLDRQNVEELYAEHRTEKFFEGVITYLSTAPVMLMILAKEDAIKAWRTVMGPASSKRARQEAPSSIRALFGTDNRLNAVYGSSSPDSAKADLDLFFYSPPRPLLELPQIDPASIPAAQVHNSLAIIKPDAMAAGKVDEIVERIVCAGFTVWKREEMHLSREEAGILYEGLREREYFEDAVGFISSGPILAMILKGDNVVRMWREMIGPTDPAEAREKFPMSIRALYGTDTVRNAVHGADSPEEALREIQHLFPRVAMKTAMIYGTRPGTASQSSRPDLAAEAAAARGAVGGDTGAPQDGVTVPQTDSRLTLERTLGLIKRDAIAAAKRDEILERIRKEGFRIVAEKEVRMSVEMAKELYKDHDGMPFFEELVDFVASGDTVYAVVLEKESAIGAWRQLAGPTNSVKAKEIAPRSLRGLYGTDSMRNAVHCSDSPASAEKEIAIFFGDAVSPHPDPSTGPTYPTPTISAHPTEVAMPPPGEPIERTLALIKPDAYAAGRKDDIVARIKESGFVIVKEEEYRMSVDKAKEFYKEHDGKNFYDDLVGWMSSEPIYALCLEKINAIKGWRELAGPTNSEKARETSPNSIRALYGTDGSKNAVHGSDSPAAAAREIDIIFGNSISPLPAHEPPTAPSYIHPPGVSAPDYVHPPTLSPTTGMPRDVLPLEHTLALIKPDAMAAGRQGDIVERIKRAGFKIVREAEVHMSREKAGEFYREHATRDFYSDLVEWMSSAPIYALELEKENAILEWRELAGPTNSEKARADAPHSIRALYGTNGSQNAVHGSDSPASAEREIRLIFGTSPSHTIIPTASGLPVQRTLALIKPDAYRSHEIVADIVQKIKDAGFKIVKDEEVKMSEDVAKEFYREHEGKNFYAELVGWMSSAPIMAMILEKEGAITGWRELAGPTDSVKARDIAPTSIRALYGTNGSHNAVHGSDSPTSAEREIRIIFSDRVSPYPATTSGIPNTSQNQASTHPTENDIVPAAPHIGASKMAPEANPANPGRVLERTFALIKPDAYSGGRKEDILRMVQDGGFVIVKGEEVRFTEEKAKEFYREHEGKPFYAELVRWMSSEPIYAMVLEREGAVAEWRALAGPTNSEKARETAPHSIRALYGKDGSQNAVHGSDSPLSANREIHVVFGDTVSPLPSIPIKQSANVTTSDIATGPPSQDAILATQAAEAAKAKEDAERGLPPGPEREHTLALIKPDAYGAGKKDEILGRIEKNGLRIVESMELTMTAAMAREFYREHEGKPFYDTLVGWMSSAPIFAMVLEGEGGIKKWRDLAGPTDSNKAREIAPSSIRAHFGTDGSHNAVHGSDSRSAAVREIRVIFGDVVAGAAYPTPAQAQPDTAAAPRPPAEAPPAGGAPRSASRQATAPQTPAGGATPRRVPSVRNVAGGGTTTTTKSTAASRTGSRHSSTVNLASGGTTGTHAAPATDGDSAARQAQTIGASRIASETQATPQPSSKKPTRASSLAGSKAGSKAGSRVASTNKLHDPTATKSEASPNVPPGSQPSAAPTSALGVAAGVLGLDTEGKAAVEGAATVVGGAGNAGPGDMGGERDGKTVGLQPTGMVMGGVGGVQGLDAVPVDGEAGPGVISEATAVKV